MRQAWQAHVGVAHLPQFLPYQAATESMTIMSMPPERISMSVSGLLACMPG